MTNDTELREYVESKESVLTDFSSKDNDMTYFEATSPHIDVKQKTVLGMNWDTGTNEFIFCFDSLLLRCATIEQTKRNLLSISASIFDPLGLIAPVTSKIKTVTSISIIKFYLRNVIYTTLDI